MFMSKNLKWWTNKHVLCSWLSNLMNNELNIEILQNYLMNMNFFVKSAMNILFLTIFFSKLAYFSAWLQEVSTGVHKSTQFINLQTSIIDLYQKFSLVYWNFSVQLSFHLDNSGKFVHEMFIGILPWTNEHAWTNEHEQWTWTFLPSVWLGASHELYKVLCFDERNCFS